MSQFIWLILICALIVYSCSDRQADPVIDDMAGHLVGSWRTSAWTGTLDETWIKGNDGWLHETAYYYEDADTSYRAHSRIQRVENDLILFSVIQNSTPKIFRATTIHSDSVVFENADYRNPFRVVYYFSEGAGFQRTITGFENDSLVSTTFNFAKQ